LPNGWTVGENFANGVKLASGAWSYPLVRKLDAISGAQRAGAKISIDNGQHYLDASSLTEEQAERICANAVEHMDDELREQAHGETDGARAFVARYAELHEAKHNSSFVAF
jgi:hypothetical protein